MKEKSPSQLKNEALYHLRDKWAEASIVGLIYWLFVGPIVYYSRREGATFPIAPLISGIGILGLFVYPVLEYGFMNTFADLHRKTKIDIEELFSGFFNYSKVFLPLILARIYTILWTFLLIIPGVVKYYSYSQLPYIVKANPGMDAEESIKLSRSMMKGNKARLFYQDLTFIGWVLLSVLSFGIGFIWLMPYWATARAGFHRTLLQEQNI